MTVLVTGAAGFIGAAVALRLLESGERVIGLDNLNAYYDPALKRARLARLEAAGGNWSFHQLDLETAQRSLIYLKLRNQRPSFIWPPRLGCATPSKTRRPTSRATWMVSGMFLKDAGTKASNIWSMPPAARCMAETGRCLFLSNTRSTTR